MEDAQDLYNYFSTEEVTRYYDLDRFTDLNQAEDLILRWDERYEAGEGIRWGIARKEDNRLIGSCGYHNWAKEHEKAEIGYELAPHYWSQGRMSEALGAVIAYGFREMKLHRIEAYYDPGNLASKQSLMKAGFKVEGLLRESFFEKGKFVDAEICSLLAEEYL